MALGRVAVAVLGLALLLLAAGAWAAEGRREKCRAQGFDVDSLLCGTCSRLRDVTSRAVGAQCLQCCHSPYDSARLEVSQLAMMRSSALNEFINNRLRSFGSAVTWDMLRTREDKASMVLLASGQKPVTVRVGQWSANDLEDYVAQYFPKM